MDRAQLESLTKSIQQRGLLQPLVVTPNDTGYYLIDGHRRLAAVQAAEIAEVPVVVRENADDELIDAVTANQQRVDLTPVEEARAFQRLRDAGMTVKQIAVELGVAQKLVTERLRLLELPPLALALVDTGDLTPGHVPTLLAMARVSPGLADGVATSVAERAITPSAFAKNPLGGIRTGYVPELEVWILSHTGSLHIDTEPFEGALSDKATSAVVEIGSLRGYDVTRASVNLDAARSYGCLYEPPKSEDAYIQHVALTDRAWVISHVEAQLAKDLKAARKHARENQVGNPSVDPQTGALRDPAESLSEEELAAQKKAQRDADDKARLAALSVSQNLGAAAFTELASVEVDRPTALLLARLVIRDEARKLYDAGIALCDPNVIKSVERKGRQPKVEQTPVDIKEREAAVFEFIERGEDGPQVIGRLLQVIAMAHLSDQGSLPPSARPGWVHQLDTIDNDVTIDVASRIGKKLPVPIRARVDALLERNAERYAARAKADAEAERLAAEEAAEQAAEEERIVAEAEAAEMQAAQDDYEAAKAA